MPPLAARPRATTPPLAFVLFWNLFTAAHGFFMLRAAWGSSAMYFLVPFYLLFFGIGFFLARTWWRGAARQRPYGTPQLVELAPVQPGQRLAVVVDFDRAWPREAQLAAQLRWVGVSAKGHSGETLAAQELAGSAAPGPRGTRWQGTALVPPRPDAALPLRLELVLQPPGEVPGSAWQFLVPLAAGAAPDVRVSAVQGRQVDTVLRWLMLGFIAAGSWQLFALVSGERRELFGLVLPGALLLTGWLLQDLRETLAAAIGHDGADQAQLAQKMLPFAQRLKSRVQFFAALAVAAFFADAFGLLGRLTGE